MGLFTGPSKSSARSSGSSPRSFPSNSQVSLPPTPRAFLNAISISPSPFFTLLRGRLVKAFHGFTSASTACCDFLSAYSQLTQTSSLQSSGSSSGASADSPSIDIQLIHAPAAWKAVNDLVVDGNILVVAIHRGHIPYAHVEDVEQGAIRSVQSLYIDVKRCSWVPI